MKTSSSLTKKTTDYYHWGPCSVFNADLEQILRINPFQSIAAIHTETSHLIC